MYVLKRAAVSFAAILCLAPVLARSEDAPQCAGRSDLAGPCYQIHGRLSIWNGTPSARIWIIGSDRMLGVMNRLDTEDEIMPKKVSSQILNTATRIYADFLVCPFDKDIPGHMRMVCVESAKNMLVEDNEWIDDQTQVKYIRIPD